MIIESKKQRSKDLSFIASYKNIILIVVLVYGRVVDWGFGDI